MPEDVKDVFGHAIDLAQAGGKHPDAKPMTGFGSAGVLEVGFRGLASSARATVCVTPFGTAADKHPSGAAAKLLQIIERKGIGAIV